MLNRPRSSFPTSRRMTASRFSARSSRGMSRVPNAAWRVGLSRLRTRTVFRIAVMRFVGSAVGGTGRGILPRGPRTTPRRFPITGMRGASAMKKSQACARPRAFRLLVAYSSISCGWITRSATFLAFRANSPEAKKERGPNKVSGGDQSPRVRVAFISPRRGRSLRGRSTPRHLGRWKARDELLWNDEFRRPPRVDVLADPEVARDAREHVRLVPGKLRTAGEEGDPIVRGELRRLIQGRSACHCQPSFRRFDNRPMQSVSPQDIGLYTDGPRDLNAGDANLPVGHERMEVAHRQLSARLKHRQVDRIPFRDLLRVQVAAVVARVERRPLLGCGCDSDRADVRPDRKPNAFGKNGL